MDYLLGFDIGSSSVKASLIDGRTGDCVASAFAPKQEMPITAVHSGWAEQSPDMWWDNLKVAVNEVFAQAPVKADAVAAIGISYQMHGLVLVDRNGNPLRPAIIWCDSRATGIGAAAFEAIGQHRCLESLLNSPGNFTASKLKWVMDNEPEIYEKTDKFLLPGDYIALKLTGLSHTTSSGLSEGILWDFRKNDVADMVLSYYGIAREKVAALTPTFAVQGQVTAEAAAALGLRKGIPVSYRAGDQPNNALSLNVLEPGEVAATAGTSGVVYGVSGAVRYDPQSRVNTFAHVNHSADRCRLGILLCINGTGILNSWLRRLTAQTSYEEMNRQAAEVPVGAEGLLMFPFGNGAERVLGNRNPGAAISGLNFNIHQSAHLYRAAQEGIAWSFRYGMDVMRAMGMEARIVRAGKANMFLSPLFRDTLATISGAVIELFNTDGAAGAARGAGIGCGYYASPAEAFATLQKLETTEPVAANTAACNEAYMCWKEQLEKNLSLL
ncbi:MAG: carbohydrate kinase [Bacteroidales bacterium]|jgi:xylulokinase|nr:carbohydrate kinase [Bacteroidales bacterium]